MIKSFRANLIKLFQDVVSHFKISVTEIKNNKTKKSINTLTNFSYFAIYIYMYTDKFSSIQNNGFLANVISCQVL